MYSLRKISKDQVETNINLGPAYSVVYMEKSIDEFKKEFKNYYGSDFEQSNSTVYAFIIRGCDLFPLSTGYRNYIVSENGNTYHKI
jgi:hypothetical protein